MPPFMPYHQGMNTPSNGSETASEGTARLFGWFDPVVASGWAGRGA